MSARNKKSSTRELTDPPYGFLIFTTAVSGALVMVLQVLGSRVVGPFYGVSLFVWTSLITVTLVALAIGYAVGGVLSDRRNDARVLYLLIAAAGVLVLLLPFMRGPVLKLCLPLGLRVGSFVSSALLFGPPLVLLGCVSPYVVKLAAHEQDRLGRIVGTLYAVSTAGSFVGTVATGFVLIAYFRVDMTFYFVGTGLLLLSASYWLLFARRATVAVATLLPLLIGLAYTHPPLTRTLPNGTHLQVIDSVENFYGQLKIIEYSKGAVRTREMVLDGHIQGGIDVNSGRSVYLYAESLQQIPRMLLPQGQSCLVIGVGAGIVPRWFSQQGVYTDAVDINPQVVELAKQHFDYRVSGQTYIQDARAFLRTSDKRYDYVIFDVFSGDSTPTHLLSVEALQLLSLRMTDRGILGLNLILDLDQESQMGRALLKTLRSVFNDVVLMPGFVPTSENTVGNVIALASATRIDRQALDRFVFRDLHFLAERTLKLAPTTRFEFDNLDDAILLTDDYNPLDFFDAEIRESVRRDMLKGTDLDVFL